MIVDAIIRFFHGILRWADQFLPNWDPLNLQPTINAIFDVSDQLRIPDYVAWLNHYLPATEAFLMLGVLLATWLAAHVWHAAIWLLSKLHIAGGGST